MYPVCTLSKWRKVCTRTSVILHVHTCLYLRVHTYRYKVQYLLVFLAQYERIKQTYDSVYMWYDIVISHMIGVIYACMPLYANISHSIQWYTAKHYKFNFVSKAEVNRLHGRKPNQKQLITQDMQTRPGYAEKMGPDNLWRDKLNDFSQMVDSNDSSSLQPTNSDFLIFW